MRRRFRYALRWTAAFFAETVVVGAMLVGSSVLDRDERREIWLSLREGRLRGFAAEYAAEPIDFSQP